MVYGLGLVFSALANAGSAVAVEPARATWTVKPVFEERERFERRDHKGFSEKVSDARSDEFDRTRAGVSYTDNNKLRGQVVFQYTDDIYQTAKANGALDNADLLLGYVSDADKSGTYTLGRQRIVVGNNRLLGESDWKVSSNAWDAVRFQTKSLDLFAGHLAVSTYDTKYNRIAGGDYVCSLGHFEAFYAHDRIGAESTDTFNLYNSYRSDLHFAKLQAEAGAQFGAINGMEHRAWMGSARLTRSFGSKLSAYAEGCIFSGGTTSSTNMEWMTPYASKHPFGGYADVQGSDNAKWLSGQINYNWAPKFSTEVVYYDFFLENDRDAWMSKNFTANKTGSVTFIDPTGRKGDQVGQELDLNCKWNVAKGTEISFGAAEFIPGEFIKSFVTASNLRDQTWFFAEFGYKFQG